MIQQNYMVWIVPAMGFKIPFMVLFQFYACNNKLCLFFFYKNFSDFFPVVYVPEYPEGIIGWNVICMG